MTQITIEQLSNTSMGRPLSPLEIPELLFLIFSFLDTEAIINTANLVSRQWHNASKRRVPRMVQWAGHHTLEELKQVVVFLPRATGLCCYFPYDWKVDDKKTTLLLNALDHKRTQSAITDNTSGNESHHDESATEPTVPLLQVLKMQGQFGLHLALPSLLPYMGSLTRLVIQNDCYGSISLPNLLFACPLLETLCIEPVRVISLTEPWVPETTAFLTHEQPQLHLRELVLKRARVHQACIESILSRSPSLQVLKLVLWTNSEFPFLWNRSAFFEHLKSTPIKFKVFHVSLFESPRQGPQRLAEAMAVCPDATEWMFRGPDLTLSAIQALEALPNVVTRLELTLVAVQLHNFLCSAPHLLHLKASYSSFDYQQINLFPSLHPNTATQASEEEVAAPQSQRPRIWACRQLQSLEMSFPSAGDVPYASRVIFGYISRVCPKLTDLELSASDMGWRFGKKACPTFCMALQGGLCLLGRLKKLRRLRVGIHDSDRSIKRWDVDWMLPLTSSSSLQLMGVNKEDEQDARIRSRTKRREIIESWKSQLQREEATLVQTRLDKIQEWTTSNSPKVVAAEGSSLELLPQLLRCGLLSDVEKMIKEMDSEGCEGEGGEGELDCWPRMKRLCLYQECSFGQSRAKEVSRVVSVGNTPWFWSKITTLLGI